MNIINIDYEKLKKEINEYILLHNDGIYFYSENQPIILMNNETLKFLKQKNENKAKVPMIFGYYIAIAEWLSFGEVKLK